MIPVPNLQPAQEALDAGLHIVKLDRYKKKPAGSDWNHNPAQVIDPNATGYGIILAANNLCSIDPDNVELARIGLHAIGFDLDELLEAGVRTVSTRPGSGGRSAFAADEALRWITFRSKQTGTVLELRAHSPNLQDCIPGVVYSDKQGQTFYTQEYANGRRFHEAPEPPAKFLSFWKQCSTDLKFQRDQQARFFDAIKNHLGIEEVTQCLSISAGKHLAFPAPGIRQLYNADHAVEEILERHDYDWDEGSDRWSPPTATGAPSVRAISGKDGLWHSDHASDPLHGTFDAWTAHVVLDHNGNVEAAIAAFRAEDVARMFEDIDPETGEITLHQDPVAEALLQRPTQDSVAILFARQFSGRLLYIHDWNTWLQWDGTRWHQESTAIALDYARAIARRVNLDGRANVASASFCSGVETFCRADRTFARTSEGFDRDRYLLNTPDGTFDLRDYKMRPHNPSDHITLSTSVAPTRECGGVFNRFLDEITLGDRELQQFLQVGLGACLSGAVESHWMMFWTGTGRNGKNTLGDLVMYILGDYARKIPSATLMAKKYEAHPTELASLKGIRLAISSEVGEGDHWHEARINELTGDGVISARYMRGDFFEFNRTHKHLIYGNHRPQLRSVTDALKSRIKIVPFNASFAGREDPDLPEKLKAEAGYVLQWLIDGHWSWDVIWGKCLPSCKSVDAESKDYFEAQSTVEAWMVERLKIIPGDDRAASACPKSSDLYADYSTWKKDRNESPVSQTRWAESMGKRFPKAISNGVRYRGCQRAYDGFDEKVF